MVSKILSAAVSGVDGYIVEVEVDLSQGLPGFDIVGLPDSAVNESKERVRTAVNNSGFQVPPRRITVNLAPANTKKEGPYFDLPIAVGILSCMGIIDTQKLKDTVIIGELSLDGSVRSVNGILPMMGGAYENGVNRCIVPSLNSVEAALVDSMEVTGVPDLNSLVAHLSNHPIEPTKIDIHKLFEMSESETQLDFSDVRGQENVKRALEIAAAGGHNILMIGPPGSGKTMMAKRIPTILPDLTFAESIELTKIYSVAGLLANKNSLVTRRPFRTPHHTISYPAMVGGGRIPKPGEVSLSHYGVLFLDELPEFHRNVLEELRQPLEDGYVSISRVSGGTTFPSNFMLAASMNPCPCGYYGYSSDKCSCTQNEINRYLGKISGPLLDRIDICAEAAAVNYSDLENGALTENSADIKKRIVAAHKIQQDRYKHDGIYFNSSLSAPQIIKYCRIGKEEKKLLEHAFDALSLSARAYHKILKIARTIADLDNKENIEFIHLTEAIQLRNVNQKFW